MKQKEKKYNSMNQVIERLILHLCTGAFKFLREDINFLWECR